MITIADLDRWEACCRGPGQTYSDKRLAALLNGRPGLEPLEVVDLEEVPEADRRWVLFRAEVLGAEGLIRVLEKIVARAVRRGQRSLRGVRAPWATQWRLWARRWLSGEDRSAAAARAAGCFPYVKALAAIGATFIAEDTACIIHRRRIRAEHISTSTVYATVNYAVQVAVASAPNPAGGGMDEQRRQLADIRAELRRST